MKNALKTFIAFVQLSDSFNVSEKSFSLIGETVTNRNLSGEDNKVLSKFREDDYRLQGQSAENMNKILELESREQEGFENHTGPSDIRKFAGLYKKVNDLKKGLSRNTGEIFKVNLSIKKKISRKAKRSN